MAPVNKASKAVVGSPPVKIVAVPVPRVLLAVLFVGAAAAGGMVVSILSALPG